MTQEHMDVVEAAMDYAMALDMGFLAKENRRLLVEAVNRLMANYDGEPHLVMNAMEKE